MVRSRLITLSALCAFGASIAAAAVASDGHTSLTCRLARAGDPSPATDPLRFDPATGADARNYPPDQQADFLHMRLEIDIPDMDEPHFTATEILRFAPIGKPMRHLRLDANGMTIHQVGLAASSRAPKWSHDGKKLQVVFDPPLAAGVPHDLRISYEVKNPVEGLYWSPSRPERPGRPARAAQLHTQGEAEMNSNWFIANDFPIDRLTTELIVTVPDGYLVSSNGELELKQTRAGRTTFHWSQKLPHPTYLVTLVVGQFDIVDIGTPALPMPVYAPPGEGGNVHQTFRVTPDMVNVFAERLDEPYPWNKYANVVVWNFGWGGMENTSATTLYDTAVLDAKALQDADLDALNSHELAHQWFGDLITCKSWEHIWLNEGFATYLESLWFEARDGYDEGYLLDIYRNNRSVAADDRLDPNDENAWMRPAMVSKVYSHPDDVFVKAANPYPKGASILHMLRMTLGDDVFFQSLREYVDRFKFTSAETSDFRRTVEAVSGRSFEQFFEQWAYRPGTPEVTVASEWRSDRGELHITVEQTQRIDAMTPAFAFTLPVLIVTESGAETWVEIDVNARRHERTVALDGQPSMVIVDPYLHVLMTPTVKQPAQQIINQLLQGPTIASRLDAAAFLAEHPGAHTTEALVRSLGRTDEHDAVRAAAAKTLGELRATAPLLKALSNGVENARVRLGVIRALGECGGGDAVAALAQRAKDENESYAVRAAALRALGKHGDSSHLDILLAALESPSQHDQIRVGALEGLASLGAPEGLEQAIRFSEIGWLSRTRPVAIRAVGDLAEHDPEKAISALLPLLNDPEERSRAAAGDALAKIGDEKALAEMRRIARTHPYEIYRDELSARADHLAARLQGEHAESTMRERIERLEKELQELKSAGEKM